MIVWLNGTFGAGKTTTAEALLPLLDGARLFDPETVGYMLGPNLADRPVADFQHWPPWRSLVVATAAELIRYTGQHLIAPQTVLDRSYLAEIFEGLRSVGIDVFHVVLDSEESLLRRRIEGSDEARQWRLDHLARYQAARGWLAEEADLILDTSVMGPGEVASRIAAALPVSQVC